MKLSFVIPAYNEEKYIGHALKTAKKQKKEIDSLKLEIKDLEQRLILIESKLK